MVAIDTRSREILFTLLQSSKPVPLKALAEEFKLSTSAVRYSLRQVNNWLRVRNIEVQDDHADGVSINISRREKNKIINELKRLDQFSLILSPIERQRYILLSLLTQKEPLLSKQMANKLGVSRPTILSDLDVVEGWLSRFQVEMDRRPGWGFSIIGKEMDIRNAIEFNLLETIGEISLLALYQGEHNSISSKVNEGHLILTPIPFTLNSLNLDFCGSLVMDIEDLTSFYFSDSSHVSMALFLAILISRVSEGYFIESFPENLTSRINKNTIEIADAIAKKINRRFKVEISENEKINIAIRISSIRRRQSTSAEEIPSTVPFTSNEIEEIVMQMIQEASKILHPILSIDQKLKHGLLVHIKPAINRLAFNLPIRNLLLDEIKSKYPYIFQTSKEISGELEKEIGCKIPDEEIGFIAMHFAAAMERLRAASDNRLNALVVCGGGFATAWMLVSRIQAEFPEINIKKVCSVLELSELEKELTEVDLVISTVNLNLDKVPIVVVSPLLNDLEQNSLNEALRKIENHSETNLSEIGNDKFSAISLITADTVQLNLKPETWLEAVDLSCKPLLETGAIEIMYIDGIKTLLQDHGPYMVLSKGVVLLHAMIGYGVNRLCMSLSTFSKPVEFGHPSNDPVSVSIVFGTIDSRSHLRALSELGRLLGNQEFIVRLKSSNKPEDALEALKQFLNKAPDIPSIPSIELSRKR